MNKGLRSMSLLICQVSLVALAFIGAFPDWRGIGTTLVLLVTGGGVWLMNGAGLPAPRWARRFLFSMLVFPVMVVSIEMLRGNWQILGVLESTQRSGFYLGPIAALMVFLGLWRCPGGARTWLPAIPLAAIVNGVYAIYQVSVLGMERAGGVTNPILFSEITLLLTVMSLCLFPLMPGSRKVRLCLVSTALMLGLTAWILAGSRGSWIAGFLMGSMLVHHFWGKSLRRALFAQLIYVGASSCLIWLPLVRVRVLSAVFGFRAWNELGVVRTSEGIRLEMWRASLQELFFEAPFLGQGYQGFNPALSRLHEEGLLSRTLIWVDHAHNDWIQVLVEHGLLGLAALVLLYLGTWSALRQGVQENGRPPELGLAVRLLGVGCLAFGLTDLVISNLILGTFWCGMAAWLALLIDESKGQEVPAQGA